MAEVHLLRVSCEGLRVLVRLNGIDVLEERGGAPREQEKKVDALIVGGDNRLEVMLAPRLRDDGEPMPPEAGAHCSVQVLWSDMDMDGPRERVLLSYAWDRAVTPLERPEGVVALAAPFRAVFSRGPWLWERSEPRPFAAEDAPGLAVQVGALRDALASRDVGALQAMLRTKHAELGRAMGVPLEEIEREMATFLGELMAPIDWTVPSPDPQSLRVQSWADGRLLSVVDDAGQPPLVGTSSAGQFALPLVFTRVEGGWVVVR